jgi:hypothetical protein
MLSGWMRTSFVCSVRSGFIAYATITAPSYRWRTSSWSAFPKRFGGGRECPYQTVEIHSASPTVLFLGIG